MLPMAWFLGLLAFVTAIDRIQLSEPLAGGQRAFIDTYGRQRFFHGVNAVVKGPPWIPSYPVFDPATSLVDEDFALLQSVGLNVIRLGSMWPGTEPSQGVWNETYIAALVNMTVKASQYGIYTFLDMHQDVLSEKFCGEGAPAWAVYTGDAKLGFPEPLGPAMTEYWDPVNQFPLRSECDLYDWGTLYFAGANGKAFQALYQNENGLRDAWAGFWAKLASSFLGHDEILAMELINEPWSGDADGHPALMIPGVADRENLQVAYDVLAPAIWNVDPSRLVMFAAVTWDDVVPVGFQHAPGGADNANRSVFAFHYYTPPQETLEPYFTQREKDAQKLGTGVMLTEFEGKDLTVQGVTYQQQFDQVVEQADKLLLSWALWEFKDFCIHNDSDPYYANVSQWDVYGSCKTGYGGGLWNSNGTVNMEYARHYARTYPQSVAGVTVEINFNVTTGVFRLVYQSDPKITSVPSEIYLSESIYYPNGYAVSITPPNAATWKKLQTNLVGVYNGGSSQTVTVTIKPL